jgi:hypothetical protein
METGRSTKLFPKAAHEAIAPPQSCRDMLEQGAHCAMLEVDRLRTGRIVGRSAAG